MDSGTRIAGGASGGGSGYASILAHAGGALYGPGYELGSVTFKFKKIGFFCFPIKLCVCLLLQDL